MYNYIGNRYNFYALSLKDLQPKPFKCPFKHITTLLLVTEPMATHNTGTLVVFIAKVDFYVACTVL